MIANLAVFYKGAVSIEALENMPLGKLLNLNNCAARIVRERAEAAKNNSLGQPFFPPVF
jgi:hypothetical protein